ncbi:hypothetical protein CI41S_50960 [Bradyrhizobium ivorense]|nr:hypothetical protein CI41S_50960 [Bradyrhizobium ivorense]
MLACVVVGRGASELMACRLYKGVRIGTFLHGQNLMQTGIPARNARSSVTVGSIEHHIARGTTTSPLISLTKSFGVARDYALKGSLSKPSATNPAYVYEIDVPDPLPSAIKIVDPVAEIVAAQKLSVLTNSSYHHDGDQSFLHFVVNPLLRAHMSPMAPRPGGGSSSPVVMTMPLEAMVFALRDAEVLVVGNLPPSMIIHRHDVY